MSDYRLLVIEDHQHISDLVTRVSSEIGFEVAASCDFLNIPSLFDSFTPHVIVLDIFMPGMDGFEILRFLRERNSTTRLVIISGQESFIVLAEKMAQALDLAIDATLTKPFRIEELRQALKRIMRALKASNENSSSKKTRKSRGATA